MWLVTFSNQVAALSLAWLAVSLYFNNMRRVQSMLVLYNFIICIVFYFVIVPINGVSSNVTDAVIHLVIPAVFIYVWDKKFAKIPLWQFMVYPVLYFGFAHFVSMRRGYMLYPFLDNPVIVMCVGGLFVGMHWWSQKNLIKES